ncbi:hypothetical protein D3C78_1277410 [compost metagenome]
MQEGEDRDRRQRRFCQRQCDLAENLETPETIDTRRLLKLARQRHEKLPHDEGSEHTWRAENGDKDQRPVSVDHAGFEEHLEQRHDRHFRGDQEAKQHDHEDQIGTRKPDTCEGISCHGGDNHRANRHDSSNIGGVPILPHEGLQLEYLRVGRPILVLGKELRREGEDVADRLDR